jgi:N-acetylneuraminic acid mutarotase
VNTVSIISTAQVVRPPRAGFANRLGGRTWTLFCTLAHRFGLVALVLISFSQRASANTWQKLPSLPAPNGGFISGELDGMILVMGGTNWVGETKHWLNTVYRFDPATLAWTELESLTSPLAYGIGVNLDGAFLVVGGTTGNSPSHGVVMVEGDHVQTTAARGVSSPAVLSAGGVIDGEIIVVGGTDDAANVPGLRRDVIGFNVANGQTRTLARFPGPGIGTAASAVVTGELFVFAGAKWDEDHKRVQNVADAWAFSLKRDGWRPVEPYPLVARGVSAVALDQHRVYLAGGYRSDDFTDCAFIFDTRTGSYTAARPLPYKGQVGLVRCGDYVYCIGGEDRMKHRTDAVYRVAITELTE